MDHTTQTGVPLSEKVSKFYRIKIKNNAPLADSSKILFKASCMSIFDRLLENVFLYKPV
jgi:hypothetical protein